MEDRFHDRELEQFVKRNADQYRMFPTEKVWKEIHSTLHTRRRWYNIGIALLLLTTGAVTWVMLSTPGSRKQMAGLTPSGIATIPAIKNTTTVNRHTDVVIAPAKPAAARTTSAVVASQYISQTNLLIDQPAFIPSDELATHPEVSLPANTGSDLLALNTVNPESQKADEAIAKTVPPHPKQNIVAQKAPVISTAFVAAPVKEENVEKPAPKKEVEEAQTSTAAAPGLYPMTIESVVNSFGQHSRRHKLSYQFYVVPTISYRKLSENEAFIESARASSGISNRVTDVNSAVTHKPDIGFELGFSTGYPITRNLRITGGLQFNVSKYDIRAFTYSPEVATIALNAGGGGNSVSTVTNYRNMGGGSKTNWLRNLYVSASIPVGLELKLTGNSRSYMGIAASVEPTYILANRAYLISTDYKNYAEVPSLTRKVNMNTGFEIFAGYSTGKLKWRVGPQVRYQTLSSFEAKYPVKEHLFDFGLKVGLMLR